MASFKNESSSYSFEISSAHSDQRDEYLHKKVRTVRALDAVRIAITVLALCGGLVILGLSAAGLNAYNQTSLPADYFLPLWPSELDTSPSVVLVVGSVVLILSNVLALVGGKVSKIRNNTRVHTPIMFLAPSLGFIAVAVSTAVFYAINASELKDTILSWSCRWQDVPMTAAPHFPSLCKQSWGSVMLAVVIVPVEFVALIVAGVQFKVEKSMMLYTQARKGSA